MADQGREAARVLWNTGLGGAEIIDPLTPEFARGALEELEIIQQGTAGVLREVLAGAQMSAEQLNVESFHGLIEVVQNADDLGAREVRVGFRRTGHRTQLLIAHDGERVRLQHVLGMTLAFISTKRDDPSAKGRFGIGLKTLSRLGDRLTVHCAPYNFTIEGNSMRAVSALRQIPGFYQASTTDTLLCLDLREGFDTDAFQAWFSALGPESMLFLDTVRTLRFQRLGRKRAAVRHHLTETGRTSRELTGVPGAVARTTLRDPDTRRSWQRYEVDWPMPQRLQRRYKARGATTPIAIAIPSHGLGNQQIYAGLPVSPAGGLPFSLNAQFDIDVARQGIQHEELNRWLLTRIGDIAASVALERLVEAPSTAWQAVPLPDELDPGRDTWLADQLSELAYLVLQRVRRGFRLEASGAEIRLRALAYEAEPLEGLIGQAEVSGLTAGVTLLPKSARDAGGRWRSVLGGLGQAKLITVPEAMNLLDWNDGELGVRDARWFIGLARAALDADLGSRLWSQPSVLTAEGRRIVPPMPHIEGELLLRGSADGSLAARLGLAHVIHPAYLSRSPNAVIVRGWLEEHEMLRDTADAEATLRALAAREDQAPLTIQDEDFRLLRDTFVMVEQDTQEELGPMVGGAILLDAQSWRAGKRVTVKAPPSDAYLPASIEDRRDGWSKAAGRTPELKWVHPRYEDVLRRPGRRHAAPGERLLAARAFLVLLGAETTPRLTEPDYVETRYGDPASPIWPDELSTSQRDALQSLQRHATHLKGDRSSPDLLAVIRDIRRERGLRARRTRAAALLATLEREWSRLYRSHTTATAVWSYGNWHQAGKIPSTWLAFAFDEPWLSNELGKLKPAKELAVRTPATEAIFGDDRDLFAYEVDESLASSPTIRALRITTDPQVSEMVDQLEQIRVTGSQPDERALALRYAAIGAACKSRDPSPDDTVGDMRLSQLRSRFSGRGTKAGLIYANGQWLPPQRVFAGAPIFGSRRAFVSERTTAERLWRALRIHAPGLTDCIDVLEEIAAGEPSQLDEEILVNTYLRMEALLADASPRERRHLHSLPLRTTGRWTKSRPVYLTTDREVGHSLASQVPVWQLPVAPSAVPNLIHAANVTLLDAASFHPVVHDTAFATGATIERHFGLAVELLRDWLARHDQKLFTALSVSWEELAGARISIDPDLKLGLRVGRRRLLIPARAHVVREPLALHFADPDAPGEDDAGGTAIASLFTSGDTDKAALAWSRSWSRAARGERGAVSLVRDVPTGDALESLWGQAGADTAIARRKPAKKQVSVAGGRTAGPTALSARRLKEIEHLGRKTLDVIESTGEQPPTAGGRRGLRDDTPPGRQIGEIRPAPTTAPLAYSEADKEDLALQVLQLAINGHESDLKDYRHLRGVGADALDKLRRYFEIKATYGTLPSEITLTANEAQRAFQEGDKFFLAIVAGLEEGYETIVRIFANPLRTLELKPTTSVTLTGITGQRPALEVRFPSGAGTQIGSPPA